MTFENTLKELSIQETYLTKFKDDFDRVKQYEDSAVKILNEQSVTKITFPKNHSEFKHLFPKKSN